MSQRKADLIRHNTKAVQLNFLRSCLFAYRLIVKKYNFSNAQKRALKIKKINTFKTLQPMSLCLFVMRVLAEIHWQKIEYSFCVIIMKAIYERDSIIRVTCFLKLVH